MSIELLANQRFPMQMNYNGREVKLPDENPTIGLLLCKSAKKTVVELTRPNTPTSTRRSISSTCPPKGC